jgi:hypothetical protein
MKEAFVILVMEHTKSSVNNSNARIGYSTYYLVVVELLDVSHGMEYNPRGRDGNSKVPFVTHKCNSSLKDLNYSELLNEE